MATYYDGFKDYAAVQVYAEAPPEEQVVYAGYTYEDYSGSALVVFEQNGELWENHDSHCSCNGLDRWSPERAEPEALKGYEGWPGLLEAVDEWLSGRRPAIHELAMVPRAVRLRE